MVPPEFDTYKAVKSLKAAGFSVAQAEAVVETVGATMGESLASKTDLELALQPMMTRADLDAALESMVSKADLELALQPMMTRADLDAALESMVSKADLELALQPMMTRADAEKSMASKADLAALEKRMMTKVAADLAALEQRMTIKLGTMVIAGMSFLALFQKVF